MSYNKCSVRFNTPAPSKKAAADPSPEDLTKINVKLDKNNREDIEYVHAYSIKQRLILPDESIEQDKFDEQELIKR